MTKFFMMVGLPGSGKSTVAEQIAKDENAIIVSSDAIRLELYGDEGDQEHNAEVFDTMHKRTIEALSNNQNVIYDATNISSKTRRGFLEQLKKYDCEKIAVMVAVPYWECVKRNKARDRKVPEFVIKRMYMNFNVPCKQEGFDDVRLIYNTEVSFDDPFNIIDVCDNIDHDNPHHTSTIGKHMIDAFKNYVHMDKFGSICETDLLGKTIYLHDIGKPFTKTFINAKGELTDIAHYYNHNNVGAYLVLLTNIPEEWKIDVALLIQYHMHYYTAWKNSEKAKKRDQQFLGERLAEMLDILHECDLAAH